MNARRKGARGEAELAHILNSYGFSTQRTAEAYRTGGEAPDVSGLPGVHIECKRVEKLNIENAMLQSCFDADQGEMAVVMHRRNRGEWLVTMKLDDFMQLYSMKS